MNKSKLLRFCKECNKKRFCTKIPIPNYNFRYTYSKGHIWEIEGVTTERIDAAVKDFYLPKLTGLFDRDDVFFRELSRNRK